MTSTELDELSRKALPILKNAGVTRCALFGSRVRGDHEPDNDVDLLIDVPRGTTLFDIVDLQIRLESCLQKRVDLVTYGSIDPRLRESILKYQFPIL